MQRNPNGQKRSRGVVLILSMLFLLLLAIVAGTVLQTSTLEFQMAGNDQFREEAFQRADAIITEISQDLANFPITGKVGDKICKTAGAGCLSTLLQTVTADVAPAGVTNTYEVERMGPLFIESLPFRQSEDDVSSSPSFDAAIFEVTAVVDGRDARLGSANLVQGVAVRVASSSQ